jgi:hypothetical protein
LPVDDNDDIIANRPLPPVVRSELQYRCDYCRRIIKPGSWIALDFTRAHWLHYACMKKDKGFRTKFSGSFTMPEVRR